MQTPCWPCIDPCLSVQPSLAHGAILQMLMRSQVGNPHATVLYCKEVLDKELTPAARIPHPASRLPDEHPPNELGKFHDVYCPSLCHTR